MGRVKCQIWKLKPEDCDNWCKLMNPKRHAQCMMERYKEMYER